MVASWASQDGQYSWSPVSEPEPREAIFTGAIPCHSSAPCPASTVWLCVCQCLWHVPMVLIQLSGFRLPPYGQPWQPVLPWLQHLMSGE